MIKAFKSSLAAFVLLSAIAPFGVFAQTTAPDGGVGSDRPEDTGFQLVPCTGVRVNNQGVECDFNQLMIGVNRAIKFLLFLSVPLVLGMLLYTGFKFITANGDPGKLASAKKMFIPVMIGLFWVLAGYIVVYTVLDKLVAPEFKDKILLTK